MMMEEISTYFDIHQGYSIVRYCGQEPVYYSSASCQQNFAQHRTEFFAENLFFGTVAAVAKDSLLSRFSFVDSQLICVLCPPAKGNEDIIEIDLHIAPLRWRIRLNEWNQLEIVQQSPQECIVEKKRSEKWLHWRRNCVIDYELEDYGISCIAAIVLSYWKSRRKFQKLFADEELLKLECKSFLRIHKLKYCSSLEEISSRLNKPLAVSDHCGTVIFSSLPIGNNITYGKDGKITVKACKTHIVIVQSESGKFYPMHDVRIL
jgi:hypothetical protein